MTQFLSRLKQHHYPDVLVGFSTMDDAGVLRLTDDLALVQTVDVITPAVDDPFVFGQIAATNSLSDVYAMGGTPISAMNVLLFSPKHVSEETVDGIMSGGLSVLEEANVPLLGGHTMKDTEVKYGLSVTGTVHPDQIWKNNGAHPGDVLVLTKPIGTGVIFQALKTGAIAEADAQSVISAATMLNMDAADAARGFSIHACTDVTGFGLAGHAYEMTLENDVSIELFLDDVPLHDGAADLAARKIRPGMTGENIEALMDLVAQPFSELPGAWPFLACDPQTSGGLMFAVPEAEAEGLCRALANAGTSIATVVGVVHPQQAWSLKLDATRGPGASGVS